MIFKVIFEIGGGSASRHADPGLPA